MEWNFPFEIAFTSLLKRGANFLGQFISNLSYFKVVAAWLTLCTILFGGILLLLSPGIGFVNAAFMATSAWGGTGLYSVEGSNVSSAGFILLYLLMYCGGTCTLSAATEKEDSTRTAHSALQNLPVDILD